MRDFVKLSLLIPLLSLMACSDSQPTIVPADISQEASNATGKLRLDIASLIGWGDIAEIKMMMGDTIELVATLENQNGESIPNQTLYISSKQGNFFTEKALLTDHNGQATSLLLATVLGKDVVIVTNQTGLSAMLPITVNDSNNQGLEMPI